MGWSEWPAELGFGGGLLGVLLLATWLLHSVFDSRRRLAAWHEKTRLEVALAARDAALGHFQSEIHHLRSRLEVSEQRREAAETALATCRETLHQERGQAAEKLRLLSEARAELTAEFQHLAARVMQQHAETFSQQNKSQLDTLLGPLRAHLGAFETGLAAAHRQSAIERATLGEQIRQLLQQGERMTSETLNLTRALKGRAQTQGAWGEMILASILERSGLVKDQHYVLQETVADDDGNRLRPDAVVRLPGAPALVIDAKVSLVAFEAHINAETDAARAAHLHSHRHSIRAHIAGLAGKTYHAAVGSPVDFVIMFIPIEGALAAALADDPHLVGFALDQGVTIATPTTLMLALRTVANVWQVDNRNQNAAVIATAAGRLYDKFVGFVDDMHELGRRLGQAQAGYAMAMSKLSDGRGNLMARAEQLRRRGAKTTRALPAELLDEEEVALLTAEQDALG
jgi:DNA recombination protein RmuC